MRHIPEVARGTIENSRSKMNRVLAALASGRYLGETWGRRLCKPVAISSASFRRWSRSYEQSRRKTH